MMGDSMDIKAMEEVLVDMRNRKLVNSRVFIDRIKGYEIWKIVVIDKIIDNYTFKDEKEANEKFESITEIN